MTARDHNRLVGIFLMIHGGMQALVMLLLGLIYGGIGFGLMLAGSKTEDRTVGLVFIAIIAFLLLVSALFLLPQILGGWKIYREHPSARIWGIVGSILSCLSFPLGTAAGVYGLWFLFGEEGKRFYFTGPPQYHPLPPSPGGWQQ